MRSEIPLRPSAIAPPEGTGTRFPNPAGCTGAGEGDAGRLRQIVFNLVGNAIKFTHHGEVVLTVSLEQTLPESVILHFAVADTGIGIAKEKQHSIFRSHSPRPTGRRLGTSAAPDWTHDLHALIEMMRGRIWVQSEVGKEARSLHRAVRLPSDDSEPLPFGPNWNWRGVRVLIVDDHPTNRRILSEMLKNWKMVCSAVESGPRALEELALARQEGSPVELLIVDWQMPEMDGVALTRRLKQDPDFAGVPVIILSSADQLGSAAGCRESGAAGYLTKPLNTAN